MKYKCYPHDPDFYATDLRKDRHTNRLTWNNARGQDVLIVQTAFDVKAADLLDELCVALNNNKQPLSDYVEVMNGVWVCYVSAADKARNNGCRLNGEASTYTVFACQKDGEICKIFRSRDQSMISQSCNIPLEVHVTVQKVTYVEGFFRRREVDTGFYMMSFRSGLSAEYSDGSLCYRVDHLEIPVTQEMLKQQYVYIKSNDRPVPFVKGKGLEIV